MIFKHLESILGDRGVISDPEELKGFTVDGLVPQAVAVPADLAQAAEVLKMADSQGWTVLIRGGGTKSRSGYPTGKLDLVLSTSRLDKIIDMDPANLTVTAQAGVVLSDLQDLLAGLENRCFFPLDSSLTEQADYMCSGRDYHKGVFLPLDPPRSEAATLGGITAAGSTGPRRLKYRLPRDLILGVRFVTPLGEIVGMGGKTVKNVSGYDVSKLMIGSFGSLGLIGEMSFRLLPLPEKREGLLVSFRDLAGAVSFSQAVLGSKLEPEALEIMNAEALNLSPSTNLKPAPDNLAVGLSLAGFQEEVNREVADLEKMARDHGALEKEKLGAKGGWTFWQGYTDGWLSPGRVKLKAGFPLAAFPEFLAHTAQATAGFKCAWSASAGCGLAAVGLPEDHGPDLIAGLGETLRAKAVSLNGSLVVEAAPREVRSKLDPWGPVRNDFNLMKRLKQDIDPRGILNPGRFVGGI